VAGGTQMPPLPSSGWAAGASGYRRPRARTGTRCRCTASAAD